MKINSKYLIFLGLFAACVLNAADARIDSWFTTYSAKYARIYSTSAAQTAGTSVTTWTGQSVPAYSGVQEIYSSANWIYIRSTGLGSHVMGPWYLNAAKTMLFPNQPVNTKSFYRIPRAATVPATKTVTGGGPIGYFVDGVAMFDGRDAFYWNGSSEVNGSGYWNRDAYVNESVTFDPALAHQPGSGQYHYHANPIALRYLRGDNVLFNSTSKTYSENVTNLSLAHSPILGWVRDGHPIYGPYGYASATNASSGVRRMISGYVLRDGQNGTDNLTATGRATIPAWAVRVYNVSSNQTGPAVSTSFPLGRYLEDKLYLGDLGQTLGTTFDLDEYNGRFCVTPEFTNGVYAYFVCISSNGAPVFPYNIGRAFYGSPTGGTVTSLGETVTTNFLGGADSTVTLTSPTANTNTTVTLVWSSAEGGTYSVESSNDLSGWTNRASNIVAQGISTQLSTNRTGSNEFFRINRTALGTYSPAK